MPSTETVTPAAPAPLSGLSAQINNLSAPPPRSVPAAPDKPPENPDAIVKVDDMEADVAPEPTTPEQATTPAQTETTTQPEPEPEPTFEVPPTPAPAPAQIPEGARNYSEYPEELVPILKALPNSKFAQYAPQLKKLHQERAEAQQRITQLTEELGRAGKKPEYFYEHPEGYKLDPDYARLEEDRYYAQLEQRALSDALIAIEKGQAWRRPIGYNQQGQMQFETVAALENGLVDAESKVAVQQALAQTVAAMQRKEMDIAQFRTSYTAQAQQAANELRAIDQRLFPKMQSEQDYTPDDRKYLDMVKKAVPRQFERHPLTPLVNKLAIACGRFMNELIKERAEKEQIKQRLEDRKITTPTVVPAGGGGGVTQDEDKVIQNNGNYPD